MFKLKVPCGISGLGFAVGKTVVSNQDLIDLFELPLTTEMLESKTGIQQRHFLAEDQSVSDIAAIAAQDALDHAGITIDQVDRLIVATSTGDYLSPSTACVVQNKLNGSRFPCHDVGAACSGFIYAVDQALRYLHTGDEVVLIVGVDARSRTLDPTDIKTVGLYGDGAGAVVLTRLAEDSENRIYCTTTMADGHGYEAVTVPSLGHANKNLPTTISMPSGSKVMKSAIKNMPIICKSVLDAECYSPDDIQHFVFHQPNLNLLTAIARKMNIASNKVPSYFSQYGNTVAASIPMTLYRSFHDGNIKRGDNVLMASIGAGYTGGAILLRWGL